MEDAIRPSGGLLRTLAAAEDDVKNGRLAPMQNSFDDLRATLLERKNG